MDVRATLREMARWKRLAARYGVTLSELARKLLNGGKVRVVMVADPELLAELRRHNNNLNQLLHRAQGGLAVNTSLVDTAVNTLLAVYRRELARG